MGGGPMGVPIPTNVLPNFTHCPMKKHILNQLRNGYNETSPHWIDIPQSTCKERGDPALLGPRDSGVAGSDESPSFHF